jgi:hypothetical protein
LRHRLLAAQRLAARLEIDRVGQTLFGPGALLADEAEALRRALQPCIVLVRADVAGMQRRKLDSGFADGRGQDRLGARRPTFQLRDRAGDKRAEIDVGAAIFGAVIREGQQRR